MEYQQIDFFAMIVKALETKPGCHLMIFQADLEISDVYTFSSKDEFDKNFETEPHPYYPSKVFLPKNIVATYGDRVYDCIMDGKTYQVNMRHAYLINDGKLTR